MMTVWTILTWVSLGLWGVCLIQVVLNRLLIDDLPPIAGPIAGARIPSRTHARGNPFPRPHLPFQSRARKEAGGAHFSESLDIPFVSIIVPARNEEQALRRAVTSFCEQDYPAFEVIVVDDRSTDATPQILVELQQRFAHLRIIPGSDPPPGWLGKPNALETGRREAEGEWLLFVDADVFYSRDVLRRAMTYALRQNVEMLCLWPNLITGGVLEAMVMSSIYLVTFAFFPSFLANRTRWRRFAVGGGAGNLVRRDALLACGAFESLRDAVVDDVGLGYRVKGAGHSLGQALGGESVRVRMYESASDAIRGFSKNTYPGLKDRWWLLLLPPVIGFLLNIVPYAAFLAGVSGGQLDPVAGSALILMHVIALYTLRVFRQPWYVAFLNPLRELTWWWILLRSWLQYRRHGVVWRGRKYGAAMPPDQSAGSGCGEAKGVACLAPIVSNSRPMAGPPAPSRKYDLDRVVRLVLTASVVVGLFLLVRHLSDVLLPFAAAVLLAYLLEPIVDALDSRLRNRVASVLLTVFGTAIVLLALLVALIPILHRQFVEVAAIVRQQQERVTAESAPGESETWRERYGRFYGSQPRPVQVILDQVRVAVTEADVGAIALSAAQRLAPGVWGVVTGTMSLLIGLMGLIIVLIYLLFLLLDFPQYEQFWRDLLPPAYREGLIEFSQEFLSAMGQYFRGQALIALGIAFVGVVGFTLIGLRMGVLLGLLIGALSMVPYLQAVGLVPALLLAVLGAIERGGGLISSILLVLLVFAAIQAAQDLVLTPRIMGRSTGLKPVVMLLSVFIWGKLLGFLGVLLAIPLTCLGLAYYRRFVLSRTPLPTPPPAPATST